MRVFIDNREQDRALRGMKYFKSKGYETIKAELTYGDFDFLGENINVAFEYKTIADDKIESVGDIVRRTLDGDEIASNPQDAAVKYNEVLSLMLSDVSTQSYSSESYGLFYYSDGHLSVLMNQGAEAPEAFEVASRDISEWLNADNVPTFIEGDNSESVLVPVADSTGRCVAVFEYKCNFNNLKTMGDDFEGRILKSVVIAVAAGIFVYIIQLLVPKIIKRSGSGMGRQTL